MADAEHSKCFVERRMSSTLITGTQLNKWPAYGHANVGPNSFREGLNMTPTPAYVTDPEFLADLESDMTGDDIATKWDIHPTTARKWRRKFIETGELVTAKVPVDETPANDSDEEDSEGNRTSVTVRDRRITMEDARDWLRSSGDDPDDYTLSIKSIAYGVDMFSNKMSAVPKFRATGGAPAWPVIQPGPVVSIKPLTRTPRASKWETATLIADPQIGFRMLDDGTLEPFHDEAAMGVALQVITAENPQQTVLMGDIIDLAGQGKYTQEAGFARTTQPAIDRTTLFGAELRQATDGQIVYIEGNHDKRMQNFVEANALSAFGLRKGGMPESWPVMSLPNLLRLDEHNIIYKDAYPTSHWWVNQKLRCEHGTRSNSSGSTAAQYMNATPHISRAHGHTHRLEVQSKTTFDRMGKIRSMALNPGCLCRVDGAVPSVHGAIGANGRSAQNFEDWQQGVIVIRYQEDDFFVDGLIQIDSGRTVYQGQEFAA